MSALAKDNEDDLESLPSDSEEEEEVNQEEDKEEVDTTLANPDVCTKHQGKRRCTLLRMHRVWIFITQFGLVVGESFL